jgi:cycloeucalenol cycloisomerase
VFQYADRGRMLLWGSMFYGSFFVISIPVFAGIDEDNPWSLGRTAMSALGVSMAVFIVLDLWAKLLGPLSGS